MSGHDAPVRFRWSARHWVRILVIASVIGVLAGLAAAALELAVHTLVPLLVGRFAHLGGASLLSFHPAILLLPVLGGAASVLAHRALGGFDKTGGTERAVRAFHREGGRLPVRGPATRALANAAVIACGGSAGSEGPIAGLGSAIGSSVASLFGVHVRERRIFLLAGCAAGVAAMFRCPLGGALFAVSIPYREPENEDDALMPAIVSAVMAYAAYVTLWGPGHPLVHGTEHLAFSGALELLPYALLAVFCALAAGLFWAALRIVDAIALERRMAWWKAPLAGGVIVGAIACVVPQVMDARYRFLQNAVDGSLFAAGGAPSDWARFFLLVVTAKCVATAFTVGTGHVGGTLGPSVFIGGAVGAMTGAICEAAFPGEFPDDLRRALIPVGVAGMLAATMRVPLAAAVMTVEITGSYGLVVPAIFVTAVAYLLGRRWGINHEQVGTPVESPANAGREIVNVLETHRVADLMEPSWPHVVSLRARLDEFLPPGAAAPSETIVVLDRDRVAGIVTPSDFARAPRPEAAIAADVMRPVEVAVGPEDDIRAALAYFRAHAVEVLPVVGGWRRR
jgi:CIC family chloride channel protein